jgi:biopolymer transport protein ExbD
VISIRSDQNAPYRYIDLLTKELQAAGALRVVFATELEQDITRERR